MSRLALKIGDPVYRQGAGTQIFEIKEITGDLIRVESQFGTRQLLSTNQVTMVPGNKLSRMIGELENEINYLKKFLPKEKVN